MARGRKPDTGTKNSVENAKVTIKRRTRRKVGNFVRRRRQLPGGYPLRNLESGSADGAEEKSLKTAVVVLTRCEVSEDLLDRLYQTGDSMVSSVSASSISRDDSTMKQNKRKKERPQTTTSTLPERLRFIQSFKITTEVNNASPRKIDVISLPIETATTVKSTPPSIIAKDERATGNAQKKSPLVATKLDKPKFENVVTKWKKRRILPWRVRNNDNIFKNLVSITSSDSIFLNAHLEFDNSAMVGTMSPRPLSRTFSTSNSSLCSKTSNFSINESSNLQFESSKSYVARCNRISIEKYDSSTRESGLIRSDSSGYHSERKLSNSPASSTHSSPDRRICDVSFRDSTIHVNQSVTPAKLPPSNNVMTPNVVGRKRKCDFKTPKLPLFKRPPSRIKSLESPSGSASASVSSLKSKPKPVANAINNIPFDDDNSDVISLFAESTCFQLDDEDDHTKDEEIRDTLFALPTYVPTPITVNNNIKRVISPKPIITVQPQKPKSVAPSKLVHESPKPTPPTLRKEPPPNPINSINPVRMDTSKINEWIVSTSPTKGPANAGVILTSLKRLCMYHFGRGSCFKRDDQCHFSHKLPHDFHNNLRELNEDKFQIALGQIQKRQTLFKEVYDSILLYYKENNLPDDLIYLIDYILKLNFDKTPFIKSVIVTLKDMGYTFVKAIDEILWTHGMKTQSLLDILLTIIVEEEDCLETNWHLIDRITKFQRNKLDYGVVSDIFRKCCNVDNPSKEFCENIYKDLIIKSHIELEKIDRDLVIKYINLLYRFDLLHYAEQLKQNNGIEDRELNIPIEQTPEVLSPIVEPSKSESDSSPCSASSSRSSDSSSSKSTTDDQEEQTEEVADENKDSTSTSSSSPNEEALNSPKDYVGTNIVQDNGKPEEDEEEVQDEEDEEEVQDEEDEEEVQEKEDEEEVQEKEEEDAVNVEQPHRLFQVDFPLQPNQDYTNSELDVYLDQVNEQIYSLTNYYPTVKEDRSTTASEKCDVIGKVADVSLHSDNSQSHSGNNNENSSVDGDSHRSEETTAKEMVDGDIVKLIEALHEKDMSVILSIMKQCSEHNMSRSFVVHTVTALKTIKQPDAYKLIINIFESLAVLHFHQGSRYTMTLLAFNVLPFLDKRKEYETAARIIGMFAKEMETFIETECITSFHWLSTIKLRYLFVFKIFLRNKQLREALKILKSSSVGVLEDFCQEKNLLGYKQRMLTEFVETALQRDVQIARETILYLMLNMESLKNTINLPMYLNKLLVKLLNLYATYKTELQSLIDNVTNGWFKYLKHSVMRAILVQNFFNFPERKLVDFFKLCVDMGVYKIHEGFKNSIEIPMNLLAEEILLVINVQFQEICKSNFPIRNIIIIVEQQIESDEYTPLIQIFTNSLLDNGEMVTRILNVFLKYFPTVKAVKTNHGWIEVSYEDLSNFFMPSQGNQTSMAKLMLR